MEPQAKMEPQAQLVEAGDELFVEDAVRKRKKKRRARAAVAESLEMTQDTRHVRFHDEEEQTEEEQAAEPAEEAEIKSSTQDAEAPSNAITPAAKVDAAPAAARRTWRSCVFLCCGWSLLAVGSLGCFGVMARWRLRRRQRRWLRRRRLERRWRQPQ